MDQHIAQANASSLSPDLKVCSMRSVTAETVDAAISEINEAADLGATIVELRIDFLKDIDLSHPAPTLTSLLKACEAANVPALVTFRPAWEGWVSITPAGIQLLLDIRPCYSIMRARARNPGRERQHHEAC